FPAEDGRQPPLEFPEQLVFLNPAGRRVGPVRAAGAYLVPPLHGAEGLGELPLLPKGGAEIAVRLGKSGLQRDGPAIGGDRLVEPALLAQGVAEVIVSLGVIRLQIENPTVGGYRFS